MNSSTNNFPAKTYGFRCSKWDLLVLLIASVAAFWLFRAGIEIWWIIPAVTGHFFLFCNVFLVWRRWELIWAATFVAIVSWQMFHGETGCWPTLFYVLPATFTVILLQIRSPWYHGVWARRLNPRLDEFLNGTLS